jgi:hypothetical protein
MIDGPREATVELALYTDALVIEGRIRSEGASLAQLLSGAGEFLTVEEARVDEHASRGNPVLAPFVRVRMDDVRFAVADLPAGIDPDDAPTAYIMLAVPPFVVTGRLGRPDRGEGIRDLLAVLPDGFVEILGGAYVSEPLGVSQRRSPVIVVNAPRIQALAPHRDVNPWAGLGQARAAMADPGATDVGTEPDATDDGAPGVPRGEPAAVPRAEEAPAVLAAAPGPGAAGGVPTGWR